jgi:hypothetical protein
MAVEGLGSKPGLLPPCSHAPPPLNCEMSTTSLKEKILLGTTTRCNLTLGAALSRSSLLEAITIKTAPRLRQFVLNEKA